MTRIQAIYSVIAVSSTFSTSNGFHAFEPRLGARSSFSQATSNGPQSRTSSSIRQTVDDSGFSFIDPSSHGKEYEGEDLHQHGDAEFGDSILSSSDYFALEAFSLGEVNSSPKRSRRISQETNTRKRFVFGNDLLELRGKVTRLRERLSKLQRAGVADEAEALKRRIRRLSLRDAEFVYGEMLDLEEAAKMEGNRVEEEQYREEAKVVRECLPHFNIGGLWVGKYGDHGYEMINVTYVGDTLIAKKVTGDKNVPRGEVTFTADLSPPFRRGSESSLAPIELSSNASKQWGTKGLMRYPGKGQVAAEGFVNAKFMEGQLIMVGEEYFSFAWVPIGHQIFFGRPSAELTLKMMRQSEERIVAKSRAAFIMGDVPAMKRYAVKCLEATDLCWVDEYDEIDDDDEEQHFQ